MVDNKKQTDRIHDQMPRFLKTRQNPNWKAIIEALGESDQELVELIQAVRDQMFVQSASSPYLDRLGANVRVSRPPTVGMDDATFRDYIPVLAYQPKQVKNILDSLLDIFFFRETTTAFTQTIAASPYALVDGWELSYLVDGVYDELIIFESDDFADINNATATEIASAINRKASNSFAVVFDDRISKLQYIRIFTNTVGSKGSIQITGGRADIVLQFTGFNTISGSESNTEWTITKVGDVMTFQHTGGQTPQLSQVEIGDIALIEIVGNEGSFEITDVDISSSSFSFVNTFGTAGVHDHSLFPDSIVRFMTPEKLVIYTRRNRAVTWEISSGEIIVEMPATPPVVKRDLIGSAHINGVVNTMEDRVSDTIIELDDATDWPDSGQFILQELKRIESKVNTISEDTTTVNEYQSRFDKSNIFTYTGKSGNQLTGVSPNLPVTASDNAVDISAITRGGNVVTATTSSDHGLQVGDAVVISGIGAAQTTPIEVPILSSDGTLAAGSKTATAINTTAGADFTASFMLEVGYTSVTVVNDATGAATDAADVDTGEPVLTLVQGDGITPEESQFEIYDPWSGASFDLSETGLSWEISSANDATRYHVWYHVTDGTATRDPVMSTPPDGVFIVTSVPSSTTFTFDETGPDETARSSQLTSAEAVQSDTVTLAPSGSLVYLASSQTDTGIFGPYVWDQNANFVLSSLTSTIQQDIGAGQIVRQLAIASGNNIPDESGQLIFDYGKERQEGPVRYFFKPNDNTLQLDPAYIFENSHDTGSAVTVIRNQGPHIMSTAGTEYPPYITDPVAAREVLQELMRQTKSVGIFLNFLIRYPEQLYATLDVYRSCDSTLLPINEEEAAACSV